MPEIRRITPAFAVAGQLHREDLPGIAAEGFRTIVNNRPDHEEASQPLSGELAAEAARLGLAWRDLPVPGPVSDEQAIALGQVVDELPGPVLAFCRSGRRSAALWTTLEARRGDAGVDLR